MRILILLILCAALCASCSGGNTAGLTDDSQHFTLTVLPQSYALGGAAETAVVTRPDAGGVVVDITAEADGLKAFYFDLNYDATRWHPVSVEQRLGIDGETIEIASTELRGRVHAGRVLTRPEGRAGISGSVTLATVRFAPGAAQPGRGVSAPPDRDGSKPVLSIDAAGILTWKYASIGDYDQNREVNAADLTPIAVNIGEGTGGAGPFPYDTIESVVDGDENGEITIADISPIAGNLLNTVAGYAVYRSQNVADYPATNTAAPALAAIATVPYEDGVGVPTQVRLTFTYDASAEGGTDPLNIFWVRPVDSAGANGSPSNQVSPTGSGNAAPVIVGIVANPNPVVTGGDSDITVTATDADGDPLTYDYSVDQGTVDASTSETTVFHAPAVAVQTIVVLTVNVDDGQGNITTDTLNITVTPDAVNEVHIAFTPASEGGSGAMGDPHGLLGDTNYTFTATDQNGNDITSETTFEFANVGGGPFPQGVFAGNVFTTNTIGFGDFTVIGTYHDGQPDEVVSNPDLAGEEMYFTIVFVMGP